MASLLEGWVYATWEVEKPPSHAAALPLPKRMYCLQGGPIQQMKASSCLFSPRCHFSSLGQRIVGSVVRRLPLVVSWLAERNCWRHFFAIQGRRVLAECRPLDYHRRSLLA